MSDVATQKKELVAPRPAATTWLGSVVSVESNAAGNTLLQRFDSKNKPGPGAAIWDADVAKRLAAVSARHEHLVPFVAMEGPDELGRPALRTLHLPEADSLHDYLAKQREPFSLRVRIEVLAGLLDALKALHERDLTHNELNAHSVLIARDPRTRSVTAKLSAYASIAPATGPWSDHSPQQPPYSYVGPHEPRDRRLKDLYAAGVVAYELLAWTLLPSKAIETPSAFAEMHINRVRFGQLPAESLITLRNGLESVIRDLLTCGERLDAKQGAHTVLQLLSTLPRPPKVESQPTDAPRSKKRWWSLLVPGVLGLAAYLQLRDPPAPAPDPRPKENPQTESSTSPVTAAPRNALPETRVEWKTNTHYDKQGREECIGYTFGAEGTLPGCQTPKPGAEPAWPFSDGKAQSLFNEIVKNNLATVTQPNRAVLRVIYFGILTGLEKDKYASQIDELRGLLAVQTLRNSVWKADLPLIQIGIANGGLDQENAGHVARTLVENGVKLSAVLGFADSRQGTQDAIRTMGAASVFTFASMLSADDMSNEPTFISQVPPNVLEAELFVTYREAWRQRSKDPNRYRNVTVYKTYGPNNRRDDIYVDSLEADIRQRLGADMKNHGRMRDGGNYVVHEFLPKPPSEGCVGSSVLDGDQCPSEKNLVIFAGRFTEFECFGKSLVERCGGDLTRMARHVLGDDSVARAYLTVDTHEAQRPLDRIPYVSKSYAFSCDSKERFPGHKKNLQDVVDDACQHPELGGIEESNNSIRRHTLLCMMNLTDLYDSAAIPGTHRGNEGVISSTSLFLSFSTKHIITSRRDPKEPAWTLGGARHMFFNEPAIFQAQHPGETTGYTPVHGALTLFQRRDNAAEQLLCSCWYSFDHKPVCGCKLP